MVALIVPRKPIQEENSLFRVVLLVILFFLFLVICGIAYITGHLKSARANRSYASSQVVSSTYQQLVFLAVTNKDQNPPPQNSVNLMKEYFIVSVDPVTNKQTQLGLIKNNFFNETFDYYNDKVFFEKSSGELATYNAQTNSEGVLQLEGVEASSNNFLTDKTVRDFFVKNDKIFYLVGICSEGTYCALGVYDIPSRASEIVIEDIHKKIDTTKSTVTLGAFDTEKNTLRLVVQGGDAGLGFATLYEINLTRKDIVKVLSAADTVVCRENADKCTDEDRVSQANMDKILEQPELFCGGAKIEYNGYSKNSTLSSNGNNIVIPEARYVGCKER